ncbi:MAG: TolC family protein [Pirellulaceae bacterium]|nr:TolC family protein [Pirellulaceae bacterium]
MPETQRPDFDANSVVASALDGNLDIQRRRREIEIKRTTVVAAQNQTLPQLDLQALHRTSGLNDNLGSSLRQMIGYQFNDLSLGLQYSQPVGYRQAKSRYQTARLEVAREAALLTAFERQLGFDILSSLNDLKQTYSRNESSIRQLEQAQKWVQLAQLRYEDPPLKAAGQESLLVLLFDYQTAIQSKVDAIVQVAKALAAHNSVLATIDEKRGALLSKWNIAIDASYEDFAFTQVPVGSDPNALR